MRSTPSPHDRTSCAADPARLRPNQLGIRVAGRVRPRGPAPVGKGWDGRSLSHAPSAPDLDGRPGMIDARSTPTVIVVGAASRDLVEDDSRGWRLGGGVSYSALTTARLGLPTGAIIGVDRAAASAAEIDLLREAGVDVHLVALDHGPVFVNLERPAGRLQLCEERSDPVPIDAVPAAWREAPGWILAPVAAELPAAWADVPSSEARVAPGW